jgi:outer membrane murein-binding lipoprotein Lpp
MEVKATMTDDPIILAAFVSGALALAGTIGVAILSYFSRTAQARTNKQLEILKKDWDAEREERRAREKAEKVVSKFRDPLLNAAYDLQSRIFNIVEQLFLPRYYCHGSELAKEYAVENTVFLIAQFLAWTELTRQEIQFIDLGSDDQTRELRRLQSEVTRKLASDSYGKGFRLFAGEQRAIGELMIDRTGELPRCIGYAAFLTNRNAHVDHWLDRLREDVKEMAKEEDHWLDLLREDVRETAKQEDHWLDLLPEDVRELAKQEDHWLDVLREYGEETAKGAEPDKRRLISVQHALIELLGFLDPGYVYFPERVRSKIGEAANKART